MRSLRPRTRKQWIIAVAASLLGLCLLCGFLGALLPDPDPTLVAVDQPAVAPPSRASVLDPLATDPPDPPDLPTPTPIPPTATPDPPTATPDPPTATPDPSPTPAGPSAANAANLRAGPGTDYPVVGSLSAGQSLQIVAANPAGDWHQLEDGAWVAAFLVANPPAGLPVATAAPPPTPTIAPTPTAPRPTPTAVARAAPAVGLAGASIDGITLRVLVNSGRDEQLQIRNDSANPVDISRWRIFGSRGDDQCLIPAGVVLQPGGVYHIASGTSGVIQPGDKCSDRNIWNNDGEDVYLQAPDGRRIQTRA